MGKTRIVAETGAGQHGVASATACALLGLECVVYMGTEDMRRQALNVFRMRLLGATVERRRFRQPHAEGRDQRSDARLGGASRRHALPAGLRAWSASVSADGPRVSVGDRQGSAPADPRAGRAAAATRSSRASAAAATRSGSSTRSSTIRDVRLIGVEAGGEAIRPGRHAARFAGGAAGVLQGTRTFVLQDAHGNIELTHSVSAGLDYAAVGPEHAWLQETGRAEYAYATDARGAEGVPGAGAARRHHSGARIGARHRARAAASRRTFPKDAVIVVNLSGRGDKDVQQRRADPRGGPRPSARGGGPSVAN